MSVTISEQQVQASNVLNNKWIGVKGIAEHFEMSVRGIWRAVARGDLMPPIKIGRCARWSVEDVQRFEQILLSRRSNGGTATPA
jgi:predicted DNA-binding transcriptional regulator AlpA